MENGEEFRTDGFFEETPTNRSKMDEVVESTLKKVMEITEEPKIKFMANITENVHFYSEFDLDTYRRILKILDELSYRQLCIIKLFRNADRIDLDFLGNPNVTPNLSSILVDCFELNEKEFISSGNPLMEKIRELYLGKSGQTWVIGAKPSEYPKYTDIFRDNFIKFAKIDQIPDADLDSILRELKSKS